MKRKRKASDINGLYDKICGQLKDIFEKKFGEETVSHDGIKTNIKYVPDYGGTFVITVNDEKNWNKNYDGFDPTALGPEEDMNTFIEELSRSKILDDKVKKAIYETNCSMWDETDFYIYEEEIRDNEYDEWIENFPAEEKPTDYEIDEWIDNWDDSNEVAEDFNIGDIVGFPYYGPVHIQFILNAKSLESSYEENYNYYPATNSIEKEDYNW